MYPRKYSLQARARIEAERLKAKRALERARARTPRRNWTEQRWDQRAFYSYIARVLLAFAHEACGLGRQGIWTPDRIRAEVDEFLRRFCIDAYYEEGHDRCRQKFPKLTSSGSGNLTTEVEQRLRDFAEWRKFEAELLEVAEGQAAPDLQKEAGDLKPGGTVVGIPDELWEEPASRHAQVDSFIAQVASAGRKISRKDIWMAAGYRNRTEFERFQRCDGRTTRAATANFTRILNMKPPEFLRILDTKIAK